LQGSAVKQTVLSGLIVSAFGANYLWQKYMKIG